MNVWILSGNLIKDCEYQVGTKGDPIIKFCVAVNNGKDKEATFVNCVIFGKYGEVMSQYLIKGQKVLVNGKATYNKYKDKIYWSCIVSNIELCGSKKTKQEIIKDEFDSEFINDESIKDTPF